EAVFDVLLDRRAVLAKVGTDEEILAHAELSERAAALGDVGDAHGRHLLGTGAADVGAVEDDASAGPNRAAHCAQRGGLARAVRSENSDGTPLGDRERDAFE